MWKVRSSWMLDDTIKFIEELLSVLDVQAFR